MTSTACDDCVRVEQLRRGAQPRTHRDEPVPAGAGMTRRMFTARALGTAVAVYGGAALAGGPRALDLGVERAAAATGPASPVLLSVFLPGGADALSVLAPTGDDVYRKRRPTLALNAGDGPRFSEDERLTWHPACAPLAALHAEGKVTVMPAVGYDDPDQSHFASRHFWEVGALDPRMTTGWMGRYLDAVGTPDNPLQGLSLDGMNMPQLATARVPVAAVDRPQEYDFWAPGMWGDVQDLMIEGFAGLGAAHARSSDPGLAQAGRAAQQSGRLYGQLSGLRGAEITAPVAYPKSADSDFPERLQGLAAMLASGLPLRCVSVTAPGQYDTHDGQAAELRSGLELTMGALAAFQRDIEARGLADRVLVHVWSEFGRRPEENASRGTDHGAAGVSFLIGTRASGRMVGEYPGLKRLDSEGNLRATSDFRAVYCSLIEGFLGTEASRVIPGAARLGRPKVLR
jgi:uncharacterized protein (DUF1501 family)